MPKTDNHEYPIILNVFDDLNIKFKTLIFNVICKDHLRLPMGEVVADREEAMALIVLAHDDDAKDQYKNH